MLYYMMLPGQYPEEDYRQLYNRLRPLLPDFRRRKADAILPARERVCSALAYLLLCYGLKEEYPEQMTSFLPEFVYGENNKPGLTGNLSRIHFNFSHCRAAIACGISDTPVGVDVQEPRPVRGDLIRRFFPENTADQAKYGGRNEEFIAFWSRYEAFGKLTGRGLSLRPEDCDCLSQAYLQQNHIILHTHTLTGAAQKKTAAYLSAASFGDAPPAAPISVDFNDFLRLLLFPPLL